MKTTITAHKFPLRLRGVSDGSVAGTLFYSLDTNEQLMPPEISVQQENVATVRIRFARALGIASLVMGPNDTLTVNARGGG